MNSTSILRASFMAALPLGLIVSILSADTAFAISEAVVIGDPPPEEVRFGKFWYIREGKWGYTIAIAITRYLDDGIAGAVTIPATINGSPVTSIRDYAFSNCSGLTSVTIPKSVSYIGLQGAFLGSDNLTTIEVDPANPSFASLNGVLFNKQISTLVAYPGGKQGSYSIPNSVTSIRRASFTDCPGLAAIMVDPANPSYASLDGVLFNKQISTLIACPSGKNGSYSIPDNVTSIGELAFSSCTGLTGVSIPNSVTSIGDYAFAGCDSLTGVSIGTGVTSVGNYAFYGCPDLTSVTIPNVVTSIGDYAFSGCSGLTGVSIGTGVTSIGNWAFDGCSGLTNITIPDSVTSLGNYVFVECSGLTSVTIGTSVTAIGIYAFYKCTGLTSLSIGTGVTSIGERAFRYCSRLTSVIIPNSVTEIGENAFGQCDSLTRAAFLGNAPLMAGYVFGDFASGFTVTYLKEKTGFTLPMWKGYPAAALSTTGKFTYASNGTSITITDYPETEVGAVTIPAIIDGKPVTSIGNDAFDYCEDLTDVTIPTSVTTIGDSAFNSCSGLTSATFLGNAPSMGSSVFDDCASGFTVTYLKGSTGFTSPTWEGYPAMVAGPEIVVQQPVGSKLVDGAAKKSFGTAKVGRTGTTKTFTIKNTGTATLSGLAISKTGSQKGDFIVTTPFKTSLAPGAATTFKVTFMPRGVGTRNASIQIKSNDANESPFDIKLTGLGVTP